MSQIARCTITLVDMSGEGQTKNDKPYCKLVAEGKDGRLFEVTRYGVDAPTMHSMIGQQVQCMIKTEQYKGQQTMTLIGRVVPVQGMTA